MELDLPALFWKLLVGEQLCRIDLGSADQRIVEFLEQLAAVADEAGWLALGPVCWRVRSASGRLVQVPRPVAAALAALEPELEPEPERGLNPTQACDDGGGANIVVWKDRDEYIVAAEALRLHEFDEQTSVIRSGLAEVCPASLLPLLTWRELEARCCGAPSIELNLLRSIAKYDGQYQRCVLRRNFHHVCH